MAHYTGVHLRRLPLLCGVCSLSCRGNVRLHSVDLCRDREGSGQPLVLPAVALKVLAGTWDGLAAQNGSLWTDLKPFLPILPIFGKRDWKRRGAPQAKNIPRY